MSVNSKTHELKQRMQLVLQGGGEKAVAKQIALQAHQQVVMRSMNYQA